MSKGLLIAFEGGEACGKSTQAKLLAEHLDATLTREPGGTDFGERVRELFQHEDINVNARAEALLVVSARAQHVDELIRPLIEKGETVVTDRYVGSSLAYQGFGRGLDAPELLELNVWATQGLMADVNILIDVPRDIAWARRHGGEQQPDRFESESEEFHHRVLEGYRVIAENDPARWIIIDGNASIDEVQQKVRESFTNWRTTKPH